MLPEDDKPPAQPTLVVQQKRNRLAVFLATVFICLFYAWYTNHAWEDWYITFRASKNLALGNGLTFTAGEPPLHSFTSPLGSTVPALCSLVAGPERDGLALWYYRFFSATLLGLAAVMLFDICRRYRYGPWATVLLLGCFMIESKIVDNTINGMETGLMMFFIALTIRAHVRTTPRAWLHLGLAWGGLMWSRPDAFVYGAAISIGFFLFQPGPALGINRIAMLKNLARAAGICTLVYLPWFAGAWIYYGSPIPNTITAKALDSSHHLILLDLVKDFFALPFKNYPALTAAEQAFAPPYARVFGGWPDQIYVYSRMLCTVACYYWLVPFASRFGRSMSFAAMIAQFYLTDVTPHPMPWYLPNGAVLVLITLAAIFHDGQRLADRFREEMPKQVRTWEIGMRSLISAQLLVFFLLFATTAYQSYWQQVLVEDGVRTQAGLWLKKNAKSPNETVMVECLGYLGFFSELKMYDYPGMGTPETVAARRKLREQHGPYASWAEITTPQKIALIREMKPDWLAFRPYPVIGIMQTEPALLQEEYERKAIFETTARIKEIPYLPGRPFLEFDSSFMIFRRKDSATK
ncbi:MAG: hypothetical protein ACPGVU_12880 [Limisphaerales bacterium]